MKTTRNFIACVSWLSRPQHDATTDSAGNQSNTSPLRLSVDTPDDLCPRLSYLSTVSAVMSEYFTLLKLFAGNSRRVWLALPGLILGIVLCHPGVATAQPPSYGGEIQQSPGQGSASYSIGTLEPDYFAMNQPPVPSYGDGGMGWLAQLNYQAGKTIGTEESLLNFSAMPYVFWENTMFLGDLSIYRLNSGRAGGFVGAGVRHYFPGMDRTLGLITSYGMDGAYQDSFKNVTLGLESRGQFLDWLTNIYLPIGEREQEVALDFAAGSQEFVGNNIQFDQIRTRGYNLSGFDMMFGTPLPSEFAQRFDMRAYAGFYNFNHPDLDDIWGWSAKLEANALKYLDMNLTVTHDDTFDTRVSFNAAWTLDPRRLENPRRTTWDRMMLPPARLYTVPKAEVKIVEPDIIAINPVTGLPYRVVHVDSITGVDVAGAGTFETPFDNIDNAVNGVNAVGVNDYDILFTWSGSQFDAAPSIVVPEGKRYLGEGDRVDHRVVYNEFGPQLMPRARGTYDDGIFDPRPLFTNLTGPGVTFQAGFVNTNDITEFSGFVLGVPNAAAAIPGDSTTDINPATPIVPVSGPTGNGMEFAILDTDATVVRFVDIHGAQGDGMVFENLTGDFNLDAIVINQSLNNEMRVDGGSPNITVNSAFRPDTAARVDSLIINRDNGSINTPDGVGGAGDNHSLLVRNTTGGQVIWTDVITNDSGGDGFLFTGSNSDISIPVSTFLENTRAQSIFVAPTTNGQITLSASRTDGNPTGTPMRILSPNNNAIQVGLPTDPFNNAFVTPASVRVLEAVSFENLNRDFSALFVADTSGDMIIFSNATMNMNYTNGLGTASAIEFFQNSTGNLTFNNDITITAPGGSGIRVSNNTVNTANVNSQARLRFLGDSRLVRIVGANVNEGVDGAAVVIGNNSPAGFPSNSLTGSPYENSVQFTSQLIITAGAGIGIFSDGNTGPISFENAVNITSNVNEVSQVLLTNNIGDINFASLQRDGNGINVDLGFANPNEPTLAELAAFHAAVDLRNNQGALRFGQLDIEGRTTGLFGINNANIVIAGGTIDTVDATALEIFTTDSQILAGADMTNINVTLDGNGVNSTNAPDHGVHLANVKGRANFTNGVISLAGPAFTGLIQNHHAGMYIDNRTVRDREEANGFDFFSSNPLRVSVSSVDFNINARGIRADSFEELTIDTSRIVLSSREALDLENIVFASVEESVFSLNQTALTAPGDVNNDRATVRMTYSLALNDEDQEDNNPQFYDFQFGLRSPDFQDFNDNNLPNLITDGNARYSVLMVNAARDNTIGVLNNSTSGAQFGYIVNNNSFTRLAGGNAFQSFVYYRDEQNSRVNMNVAMNEMVATSAILGNNATRLGAIGFNHNSNFNEQNDNMVFTASDNSMQLPQAESSAYYFITRGTGTATIIVDDIPDDGLVEDNDTLNDLPLFFNPFTFAQTDFNPDILVAGTAFRFDLSADANVTIANSEIYIDEDTEGQLDADTSVFVFQRGFWFENVAATVNANISNNTLAFEDSNATGAFIIPKIDPISGAILTVENDLLVVEMGIVTGQANLQSTTRNNAIYFDGATSAALTNPVFLFDAPSLNNISGQFNFNDVFVP